MRPRDPCFHKSSNISNAARVWEILADGQHLALRLDSKGTPVSLSRNVIFWACGQEPVSRAPPAGSMHSQPHM